MNQNLNRKPLIKPERLKKGDTLAIVGLSWGGAKEYLDRYKLGRKRLEEVFGFNVIEMSTTLMGESYVAEHPEERARDLMAAFEDPTIQGIICTIGGDDTLRLLPYIDFDIIRNNPKVFMGYSDTTVNHFMCYKAGLISYYGPGVLGALAENVVMDQYTIQWVKKVLMSGEIIDKTEISPNWYREWLPWNDEQDLSVARIKNVEKHGYELVQGTGKAKGYLLGGCLEVLDDMRGTGLWPEVDEWKDKILFIETSMECMKPDSLQKALRILGTLGVISRISGLIIGKPYDEQYYNEYKDVLLKVIGKELKRPDLPILYNLNFGHMRPQMILPYGVLAEIDCNTCRFSILESGVI